MRFPQYTHAPKPARGIFHDIALESYYQYLQVLMTIKCCDIRTKLTSMVENTMVENWTTKYFVLFAATVVNLVLLYFIDNTLVATRILFPYCVESFVLGQFPIKNRNIFMQNCFGITLSDSSISFQPACYLFSLRNSWSLPSLLVQDRKKSQWEGSLVSARIWQDLDLANRLQFSVKAALGGAIHFMRFNDTYLNETWHY